MASTAYENNTRSLAIANRSRASSAHTVTRVNFQGDFLTARSTWDTGGGGHCWNHKFQCRTVFVDYVALW